MLKSIMMPAAAIAIAVAAWVLLPMRGHEAQAQSGPLYINAVDLDINPADIDKFLAALKTNGAAAVQVARMLGPGHTVVTVLCDSGAKYLSRLFNPEWLAHKGLLTAAALSEQGA